MDPYTLYPRLVVSVGWEFLESTDIHILETLAQKFQKTCAPELSASDHPPDPPDPLNGLETGGDNEFVESLDSILSPRVYGLGNRGYLLDQTGADYSLEVQSQILSRWIALRASKVFLGILKSAQLSLVPRIIFEPFGMYPQKGSPPIIGDIGKKKLSAKKVRRLLGSLKMAHEHYWPLDMLANIVEPYAKRTRG
jgi:hypothetical protein